MTSEKKLPPKRVEAFFLQIVLHFFDAFGTNVLALEILNIFGLSAKDASRFILFQDDVGSLHKYFQGVPFSDAHGSSQFDGDDDSSKFIHLSYDACGFHSFSSLLRYATNFDNLLTLNTTKISILSQHVLKKNRHLPRMLNSYTRFFVTPVSSATCLTASLFLNPRSTKASKRFRIISSV